MIFIIFEQTSTVHGLDRNRQKDIFGATTPRWTLCSLGILQYAGFAERRIWSSIFVDQSLKSLPSSRERKLDALSLSVHGLPSAKKYIVPAPSKRIGRDMGDTCRTSRRRSARFETWESGGHVSEYQRMNGMFCSISRKSQKWGTDMVRKSIARVNLTIKEWISTKEIRCLD